MHERCPICASIRLRFVRAFGTYRLWHCDECGVQHWTPLVHPDADYYESEAMGLYADKHRGESGMEARFLPFLERYGRVTDKDILDVGCSDGWLLAQMAQRGNRAHGIDIDTRALEVARSRGLEHVLKASAEEFVAHAHERALRFDLVTMFDVLEHTTDPSRVLRDLASVLKPDGRLIGTVPHRRRFFADLVVSDYPPHHFFRFDIPALRSCVQHAGLLLEHAESFEWGYAGPVALAAARRRVRVALGYPAEARRPSGVGVGGGPRRRSVRSRVSGALVSWLGRSTMLPERALGRGFKLFFVARAPQPA
ncbi:MAG: methyltransferase domain-containing protein [Kofleriaceae bacterium]|nr:MAG: methyltransferase domain-containing protein [Kofleriaceae bacterium]